MSPFFLGRFARRSFDGVFSQHPQRPFPPERVMKLDDEALRAAVLEAADNNNLVVDDI